MLHKNDENRVNQVQMRKKKQKSNKSSPNCCVSKYEKISKYDE